MVGWVNVGGSAGMAPGPDGGARFKAGPEGTSGTEAGGTGGGRSLNIWAEPETGIRSAAASASAGTSRPARPYPPIALPLEIMAMLFTENAANSSLQTGPREVTLELALHPNVDPAVVVRSQYAPRPLLPGINHAYGMHERNSGGAASRRVF
jgi:hypothetical protein